MDRMVKNFRSNYTENVRLLLNGFFFPDSPLFQMIDNIHNLMMPIIELDHWESFDFTWSWDDMQSNYDQTIHADTEWFSFGLKGFITERYETAMAQLDPPMAV